MHGATRWQLWEWHPRQPWSPTLGFPLFLEAASLCNISALPCVGQLGTG